MHRAIQIARFGGPEVLELARVATPVPKASEVLIKVSAVGVNPVDTYVRAGTHASKPNLPYTPGHDAAGTVVEVGGDVQHFSPGDRVYTSRSLSGAYAEMSLCEERSVHKLPDSLSFEQGASIGTPYCTAYRALFQRGGAKPGEHVLIHGASGSVGIAAAQLASSAGLVVYGTAGTQAGFENIKKQGVAHALNHTSPSYVEELRELLQRTGRPQGLNMVVEMLANQNLHMDLSLLGPGGRAMVVGNRGSVEINPRDLMGGEKDIRGVFLLSAPKEEVEQAHAFLYSWFTSTGYAPLVRDVRPLADAATMHQRVLEPGAMGKLVLSAEDCDW